MARLSKVLSVVGEYLVLTFGTLLYCMAWDSFLIPNNITSGGMTGLCVIIQFATNGMIPVSYSYTAINVLLLILAFWILGKGFGVKTIYCIALSSILFEILPRMHFLEALPGNFLYVDNKLLIPIIGGLVEAVGVGLIMQKGGSTGGTDIAALIVNKFWPVSPGKVYLYSDIFIIASVLLLPGKVFSDMVFGYITMLTFSFMLDYVLMGSKSSVQLMVFSSKYEEIAQYIMRELHRGVTAFNATGMFTHEDRKVLMVIARKSQLSTITKAIKEIDNKAFVSVAAASNVYGEGFEQIKAGISRKKGNKTDMAAQEMNE